MCALTVTKLAAQDLHLRHHLDTPTASVRLALGQIPEYLESEYRESQGEATRELQLVLDPDFL